MFRRGRCCLSGTYIALVRFHNRFTFYCIRVASVGVEVSAAEHNRRLRTSENRRVTTKSEVPLGPLEPSGDDVRHAPLRRPRINRLPDQLYVGLVAAATVTAIGVIGYWIWKAALQTGPTWHAFGVWGFITGRVWNPSPANGGAPIFGALPMIYGTLLTAFIALIIAAPLAIGIALATSMILPRKLRGPIAVMVDLLAAVPSVVYGFWGIVVLLPVVNPVFSSMSQHQLITIFVVALVLAGIAYGVPPGTLRALTGASAVFLIAVFLLSITGVIGHSFTLLAGPPISGSYMAAGLILAIMILPIMTSIIRVIFLTVPQDQREAAYALGATRWEMICSSMLPWSRSGIVGASTLGFGRAVGETIALALLLGNSPNIGGSLFLPGATIATKLANELGEASGLQLSSLTALGLVLLVVSLIVNLLARFVVSRASRPHARRFSMHALLGRLPRPTRVRTDTPDRDGATSTSTEVHVAISDRFSSTISTYRRVSSRAGMTAISLAVGVGLLPLVLILAEIVIQGVQVLNLDFFTKLPPLDPSNTAGAGIANALIGTLIVTGLATAIAAPFGLLTALFIFEAERSNSWRRKVAHVVGVIIDLLVGAPSIVVGLIVYLGVVIATQSFSALAGGIALAIIMFPIIVRSSHEVIRLVSNAQTEGALALGAPRWRAAFSVVLPTALPGILTGIVLAVARAAGETAPLLFTAGANQFISTNINRPIAALPETIYNLTISVRTPQSVQFAWGVTLVLVTMILILNLGTRLLSRLIRPSES